MSTQQPAAPGDESNEKLLLRRVEEVSDEIHQAMEINLPSDPIHERKDLDDLSNVLDKIKGKKAFLPESKKELLEKLLPEIERTLRQRRPQPKSSSDGGDVLERKKKMLSAAGCSPFSMLTITKSPLSQEKINSRQQGGGGGGGGAGRKVEKEEEEEEEDEEQAVVSLKMLVRLGQHVLEPEQYYEWTTSYVDESRIFGWDEEAGQVMDSLIDFRFRVAAITGVHGSGKTALAQKVFVHDKAKDHFPIRLWVCVGPPDSEDRFNLLYRMLDNLGLDTNRVEDVIVDGADVVKKAREKEKERILREEQTGVEDMKRKAREIVTGHKYKYDDQDAMIDQEFKRLLNQKIEGSLAVEKSKIGVLLYILHMTLSKTGYLIVFDDIRVYRDDGWYNNLTLPPPTDGEWGDRLAYGLPKKTKHRNAVLLTCRKEDDARAMVRTGRVFRPPPLQVDNGWKLFTREYTQAKDLKKQKQVGSTEDLLFKELEEMNKEIVQKCLGLPVAIIEAAKGFALSDFQPLTDPPPLKKAPPPAPAPAHY
ncbi:hypothetical protein QOZ80_7BG0583420 [Eleusine coracana subsp. coracana]|nr:hypothetical protein QOZ80_7BG0583420 [Eleusine coracana subsp. coracana]